MKKIICAVLFLSLMGCTSGNDGLSDEPTKPPIEQTPETPPTASGKMKVTVGTSTFTATLVESQTVEAWKAMLPLTVNMSELNSNEKYYYMSSSMPTASQSFSIIQNGDVMLYGSNCLVVFYKSHSSGYSYTRIGRIDDPTGLEHALGTGNVTVKFELK